MRKLATFGFSEKALATQEPMLQGYAYRLMERLKEVSKKGSVDMAAWWIFSTFVRIIIK